MASAMDCAAGRGETREVPAVERQGGPGSAAHRGQGWRSLPFAVDGKAS